MFDIDAIHNCSVYDTCTVYVILINTSICEKTILLPSKL